MLKFILLIFSQILFVWALPAPGQPASPCRHRPQLDKALPAATTKNPHQEGYAPAAVITSTGKAGVVQILPPLTGTKPDTTGTINTALETQGRFGRQPLLTNAIPEPTALLKPLPVRPMAPDATSSSMAASPPSSDIFSQPIATSAPSSMFQVKKDHPVPRLGIGGPTPIGTNKFYANFYLGKQNSPSFVHPYSLSWNKGKGNNWGLAISHIEAKQMVYGKEQPTTGAAKYFLSPVGVQSLCLSATELSNGTKLTTDNLAGHSLNVNLHAKDDADPMMTFPIVQGMGFVTAKYNKGTPLINTGIFFKTVTRSTKGPKPGVTKYTFNLEDGSVWHAYAVADKGSEPLDIKVVNNSVAKASKPFTGLFQVAKDPGKSEAMIDSAAAAYPTGVNMTGTAVGNKGSYTFHFQKAGDTKSKLLMYALPHHVNSFDNTTHKVTQQAQLQTTTKGLATAVLADSWTMIEPNMPVKMDFAPWDPAHGPKTTLPDSAVKIITPVAQKEISQNVDQQSDQDSMYFGGKALAKFAGICYTTSEMLKNPELAASGLKNLKTAFARFATNKQKFPLYYESAWGGLVSSATYETGNNGADFGNTFYNDHHFHYGYFIYAAAVIGHLDPSWLTKENVEYVNTMVRDVANPSRQDKYFPEFRNFDWYHGHSWAHGLYETSDGKDQESSSEDAMHAYAIKMWGKTSKDANMEARGNLMLSVIARSLSHYYLYTADNKVQPSKYIGNRVAGIMFENKCDHTTYFGSNIEYIQGIHMIPLLPSTKLTRSPKFVKEEWEAYFDKGRADKMDSGWKGILYGNLATVDPKAAWTFFSDKNFNPSWLDGGASLTWYQAYTAGESAQPPGQFSGYGGT